MQDNYPDIDLPDWQKSYSLLRLLFYRAQYHPEFGHLLGFQHDVMHAILAPGVRDVPVADPLGRLLSAWSLDRLFSEWDQMNRDATEGDQQPPLDSPELPLSDRDTPAAPADDQLNLASYWDRLSENEDDESESHDAKAETSLLDDELLSDLANDQQDA